MKVHSLLVFGLMGISSQQIQASEVLIGADKAKALVRCANTFFDREHLQDFARSRSIGEINKPSVLQDEITFPDQARAGEPLFATASSDKGTFVVNHAGALFFIPHEGSEVLAGRLSEDALESKIIEVLNSVGLLEGAGADFRMKQEFRSCSTISKKMEKAVRRFLN